MKTTNRSTRQSSEKRPTATEKKAQSKGKSAAKAGVELAPSGPSDGRQTSVPGSMTSTAPRVASEIAIEDLRPDPKQPRKTFELDSITVTIEVDENGVALPNKGIRDPLRIRRTKPGEPHLALDGVTPRPGPPPPWTLIEGERRYRSAIAKGLRTVPCLPPEEHDAETLLAEQLGASVGKSPLSALEMSDGVVRLAERGWTPERIAKSTGLGVRRVRRSLRLARLAPEVRDAFMKGHITETVAVEIASIETHADQVKCLKGMPEGTKTNGKWARESTKRFHLELVPSRCGFDPADASLEPGPCESCPKNTKAQRTLWLDLDESEEEEAARCTDRECYEGKREQVWNRRVEKADEEGVEVIDGDDGDKLFPNTYFSDPTDPEIVDLDSPCDLEGNLGEIGQTEVATWRRVLGGAAGEVRPEKIVRAHGKVREVVTLARAKELLEARGLSEAAQEVSAEADQIAEDKRLGRTEDEREARRRETSQKKWEKQSKFRARTHELLQEACFAQVKAIDDKAAWRILSHVVAKNDYFGDEWEAACQRRGIPLEEGKTGPETKAADETNLSRLLEWIDDGARTKNDLRVLTFELVLSSNGDVEELAAQLEVDANELAQKAAAELGIERESEEGT